MIAIGLMSGTSLDGVDAALVEIKDEKYYLLKYELLPYEEEFRARLMKNLSDETASLKEICSLNFELGYKFVNAIDKLLAGTPYKYEDIAFVASHGQTIWHNPRSDGVLVPSTLQIGEPGVITYYTNIPVVANFRSMDIIAGGEGAPMVPMSEYLLFRSATESVVLQNIGGIGNLTYIPKNAEINEVIAFDTGPGNVMIDYYTNKYFSRPYDDGGRIALSGKVIGEILTELKQDPFITRKPPKSTGREQYNQSFMEGLAARFAFERYDKRDIIATVAEFTVYAIAYGCRRFIGPFDRFILGGGGSHNLYIVSRLEAELGQKIYRQEDLGFNGDAKEAMAFAILGYLTLQNKAGNIKSVTGAREAVVLGNITPRKDDDKWRLI